MKRLYEGDKWEEEWKRKIEGMKCGEADAR
jgi:hypothetical protein